MYYESEKILKNNKFKREMRADGLNYLDHWDLWMSGREGLMFNENFKWKAYWSTLMYGFCFLDIPKNFEIVSIVPLIRQKNLLWQVPQEIRLAGSRGQPTIDYNSINILRRNLLFRGTKFPNWAEPANLPELSKLSLLAVWAVFISTYVLHTYNHQSISTDFWDKFQTLPRTFIK